MFSLVVPKQIGARPLEVVVVALETRDALGLENEKKQKGKVFIYTVCVYRGNAYISTHIHTHTHTHIYIYISGVKV